MSEQWYKIITKHDEEWIVKGEPGVVRYMEEGARAVPVVVLTVEEHARLQHAADVMEVMHKFRGVLRD